MCRFISGIIYFSFFHLFQEFTSFFYLSFYINRRKTINNTIVNKFLNNKIQKTLFIFYLLLFLPRKRRYMFSKSCEYAIKALIFVAQKSNSEQRASIIDIAHGTDAPIHFIAKIMQALSRRKFVLSVKGPNGGFFMTEKENQTSLSEIVKVFDGDSLFTDCVLGLKACSEKTSCPMHSDYKSIKANIIHLIEFNTIGSIQKRMDMQLFFTQKEQSNFL